MEALWTYAEDTTWFILDTVTEWDWLTWAQVLSGFWLLADIITTLEIALRRRIFRLKHGVLSNSAHIACAQASEQLGPMVRVRVIVRVLPSGSVLKVVCSTSVRRCVPWKGQSMYSAIANYSLQYRATKPIRSDGTQS